MFSNTLLFSLQRLGLELEAIKSYKSNDIGDMRVAVLHSFTFRMILHDFESVTAQRERKFENTNVPSSQSM